MADEWVETTLGEIADINPEATPKWPAGHEIRYVDIASVSATSGINLEEVGEYSFGEAPGRARRRIRVGDVLVSTVRPNLRAFAVVPRDLDGEVASTGFAVLRAKSPALPGFIWSLVQSEAFVEDMVSRCTGSNYPAVRANDVSAFPVWLPPLPVQRRIVDLMAHLDTHITNLRTEREAATNLLSQTAVERLALPGEVGIPIHELLLRNIGGVWGELPGEGEETVDVFRSTEFTDLGYLAGPADARRDVTSGQLASRMLAPGDLLVEKSGGTPTRPVGRVVRVDREDIQVAAIGANFLQLLRVNSDLVDPDYLFWNLWASHRRGDAFGFQQASTNIRNLKTKDYLARCVDLPSREEQVSLAAALDAGLNLVRPISLEIGKLVSFRGRLLSDLLSAALTFDVSYDSLLSEVA